jgi:HEAT repeat protein
MGKNNSKKGNRSLLQIFACLSLSSLLGIVSAAAFKVNWSKAEEMPAIIPELWEIEGIMTAFADRDPQVWVEALNQLSKYELNQLKPIAKNSQIDFSRITKLLEYKQDIMVSIATAKALGEMGELAKEQAPHLVQLLKDSDWRIRVAAAEALGEMGEAAKEQAPKLGELLQDSDSNIRWVAAKALGGMGQAAKEQAPKLVQLLKDSDWRCRGAAAKALGGMGQAAKEHAPLLIELLKDSDWRVRRAAAEALGVMGEAAKEQSPKLGELLKDSDWRVRRAAAEALGGIGEAAKGQAPRLGELLKDIDSSVRRASAEAIGKMGKAAKEQAPKLVERLKEPDSSVRWAAAQALGEMGEAAKEQAPKLGELLKDPNSSVRWAAAQALGEMGATAKEQAPLLVELLKDPDWSVAIAAAEALGQMGKAAKEEVPKLVELLKDPNTNVRTAAAEALARMGETTQDRASNTIELLQDTDTNVRKAATEILGRMGKAAKGQAPKLVKLLKDPDNNVRRSAAIALGRMGEEAKEYAPKLVELLKDSDTNVRRSGAIALGLMGEAAKEEAPKLLELLKDSQSDVRIAAAESLKEMGPFGDIETTLRILDVIYQYPSEATKLRFLAYFLSGGENEAVDLVQWLGLPKTYPERLTHEEGVEILKVFAQAWAPSQSFLRLRNELEKQIAVVSDRVQWQPKNLLLLQGHYNNLKSVDSPHAAVMEDIVATLTRWHWFLTAGNIWLTHALFWLILILAYPKYPKVRSIFFWNPWVRVIVGLGYIDLVIVSIPYLRSRLFVPFKSSFLVDADLENFDSEIYFANLQVKNQATGRFQVLKDAIPKIIGQIVLKGESGCGKSMFLRYLVKHSKHIVVYLRADKCDRGVSEAIETKLHGQIQDSAFVRNLIRAGAIDICIDGLNEVNPETRTKITEFVENYFRGNIIIATQPLHWRSPAKANTYILQPLEEEQIEPFLRSRPCIDEESKQTCTTYLTEVFREYREAELHTIKLILSNPTELSTVAQIIAFRQKPDLFDLQRQQYKLMAEEYESIHCQKFPLTYFAEQVYQMRLNDEVVLPKEEFLDELQCMQRHRMVVCQESLDAFGNPIIEWKLRHERIMDFFILQIFFGQEPEIQSQHVDDPRFRGIYLQLANVMSLDRAMELRERLLQHAVDTQDHHLSDRFIQLLRSRRTVNIV